MDEKEINEINPENRNYPQEAKDNIKKSTKKAIIWAAEFLLFFILTIVFWRQPFGLVEHIATILMISSFLISLVGLVLFGLNMLGRYSSVSALRSYSSFSEENSEDVDPDTNDKQK